jgi:hypothetical protein
MLFKDAVNCKEHLVVVIEKCMSMENWCNDIDRRNAKYVDEKTVPVPLCQSPIPHGTA